MSRAETPDQIYKQLIGDSVLDGGGSCETMAPRPILCLATPDKSLLLQNPLGMNNHPATFFPDTNDPLYQTILNWIATGAPEN